MNYKLIANTKNQLRLSELLSIPLSSGTTEHHPALGRHYIQQLEAISKAALENHDGPVTEIRFNDTQLKTTTTATLDDVTRQMIKNAPDALTYVIAKCSSSVNFGQMTSDGSGGTFMINISVAGKLHDLVIKESSEVRHCELSANIIYQELFAAPAVYVIAKAEGESFEALGIKSEDTKGFNFDQSYFSDVLKRSTGEHFYFIFSRETGSDFNTIPYPTVEEAKNPVENFDGKEEPQYSIGALPRRGVQSATVSLRSHLTISRDLFSQFIVKG